MRNGLLIFAGALGVVAFSWTGVVLSAHLQLTHLAQYKDVTDDSLNPQPLSGLADQGRMVYQDLGCASCHTQQVRRDGFGGDVARKWGDRQSVARDYIREKTVLIGTTRFGPDLRNVAKRVPSADYFYKLLYHPGAVAPGMPAYPFLFEVRKAVPGQPAPLTVSAGGTAVPPGSEVVPTRRAQALVAYLLSLNDTYEYPEAKPFVETEKKE